MGLPIGDDGKVTISLADYKRIEREVSALRDQLRDQRGARGVEVPSDIGPVINALVAAIDIVKFAVGNLPPESIRGWSTPSLRELANRLLTVFPNDADYDSLSVTLNQFAAHCDEIAQYRAQRLHAAIQVVQMAPEEIESSVNNP